MNTSLQNCCDDVGWLERVLPPKGATAGRALQHAKSVLMDLFSKHDPMIFKIGYSHNVTWRWSNTLYGYQFDRADKWTKMVILYESTEPFGPAMLEASLIDLYKSTLQSSEKIRTFCS